MNDGASLIAAWASLFTAVGLLLNAVQNVWMQIEARRAARRAEERGKAVSAMVDTVNVKVDAVAANTNGHMSTLIAAVAPVDPPLAAATLVKVQVAADSLREKLDRLDEQK